MALKKEKFTGKPEIDLREAWIDTSMGERCNFLWGIPVNHPHESLNGILTHTSFIVEVRGDVVETKRSVYNILSWDEKKVHPQTEMF